MDMKTFTLAKHDPDIQRLIATTGQKTVAQWAIDCLERFFPLLEQRLPAQEIPRTALKILKDWMEDRISMWEARKYCWTVLKLARDLETKDKICCQIVRATSHCLATCHVPTHAEGTAMYVISAIQYQYEDPQERIRKMESERAWQIQHLQQLRKKENINQSENNRNGLSPQ